MPFTIDTVQGFYPIVYVRGFTPTSGSREDTFYDTYYGYAETAVEKRSAPPPQFLEPIVFEGQLIRLLKEYHYIDAANGGLRLALNNPINVKQDPTRSLWISRFYDPDVMQQQVRPIEQHAEDLRKLICETIPNQMNQLNNDGAVVDLGQGNRDYKVILIAHSMGGLICRCLIQKLFPGRGEDATRWIHRLVTIGTPHQGIEAGAVPDFLEEFVMGNKNAFNTAIFKEPRMRDYLGLTATPGGQEPELHSLNGKFPEGRCLCVIGSDHESYNLARTVIGNHSDGLVKQSNAYIKGAYWVNVHRAHSGRRGIVNSFESYENIRRFLFGDTRVKIWLEDVDIKLQAPASDIKEFYDLEFSLSIRGTGIFLHQRKQVPCENAMRYEREEFPLGNVHLHAGFMDTTLQNPNDPYSHFVMAFRVAQHQVKDGFFFDHQYPERTIYSESLEIRVNLDPKPGDSPVDYRWLSETTDLTGGWTPLTADANGVFSVPFRTANTLTGMVCIKPGAWPNANIDDRNVDAALML